MINEHIIKISGKCSVEMPLEFQKDYKVTLEGEVRSITDITNDDGSQNRLYGLKTAVVSSLELSSVKIPIKDKSSVSKRIRACQFIWQNKNDSDIDYEQFGSLVLSNFDELMNFLIELRNQ